MIGKLVTTPRQFAALAVAAAVGGFMVSAAPALAETKGCPAIQKLSPGGDDLLDLAEARALASQAFTRLDEDGDGKLQRKEAADRLSSKAFKAANPDGDKTLEENEYMALIEQRFQKANPDQDGTIDCQELASKDGKALKKLIK